MFQVGDKVVLINKRSEKIYDYINFNNIYNVTNIFTSFILIYVKENTSFWYSQDDFISVIEFRKQKIKKIKERIYSK